MVRSRTGRAAALMIAATLVSLVTGCAQHGVRAVNHERAVAQSAPAKESRRQVDKVLISAGEWNGVDVYDNREPHSEPMNYKYGQKWQCVEVVQRFYSQKWGYPPVWPVSYAYQMWQAAPAGLVKYPSGDMSSVPVWGDAIVYDHYADGRGAGHVVIVVGLKGHKLYVIQQNSGNGREVLSFDADHRIGCKNRRQVIIGWLHSPRNIGGLNITW